MKYKLNESRGYDDLRLEILARRGIDNPEHYLNTYVNDILSYSLLGESINMAYKILKIAIEKKYNIGICVDPDLDGQVSSSILYSYLYKTFGIKSKLFFHNGKEHGLSDKEMFDNIIKEVKNNNLKLIFLPDSGTNDVVQSEILYNLGARVISLDHHIIEKENDFAIIINPQSISEYPNLNSSGGLVTWKFLKAIDEFEWIDNADYYLDLVATSLIGDGMDIRNIENRAIIDIGLSNINNKFLIEAIGQDYRIKETPPTPIEIAFYFTPLINGMIRSGKSEEKELMFRAFCEIDEDFEYTKRDKSIVVETIYQRVYRLCGNAKSRQDNAIKKGMEIVTEEIKNNQYDKHKIIFAICDDRLDKSFSGLVAMKIANQFNKPCVLLRNNGKGYFSGSLRNFNDSPLLDLKGFLQSLGYVAWSSGHLNAAGIGLSEKQLKKTIQLSDEKLRNYDFSVIHKIDFEFDYSDLSELTYGFLNSLYGLRFYYGNSISESKLLIKNIPLNTSQLTFFAGRETWENKNHWKFLLREDVDICKFGNNEKDCFYLRYGKNKVDSGWDDWKGNDLILDVVVRVGRSEFNGESKWSLIVDEYEIRS